MAIKRRGIIARPGTYHYSWGDEVKTEEDLRESLSYSPTIRLTLGHPSLGRTRRSDFLGFVKPSWDEEIKAIVGDFWFYEEHLDKIPERVRHKIISGEPWKISPSFTLDDEDSKDGVQRGTLFDHVAILREEESPVCPLGECGVNVRLESESEEAPRLYYEQESVTGGESVTVNNTSNTTANEVTVPEAAPSPDAGSTQPEASSDVDALRKENAELKSIIAGLKQQSEEAPAESKPEVSEEVKEKEEATSPPPVPEVIIPAGAVPKNDMVIDERTGWLIVERTTRKES